MAIHLPSNIYTAGAERFNSQSEVNLYAQLAQRKEARDQALNEYYQKLHTSINPAGMRTKDIDSGFSQKLQDWQKHYFDNRDKIKNPRSPEDRTVANEHMARYQDLLMDINKSKEAAAQEMELAKQKISGKWNPTSSDLEAAHKLGSSIYSQDYYKDQARTQPITINDISLNVPEFDPKQQEEFYKASVGELKPGKVYDETNLRKDKATGQVFIPFKQSYGQDQIKRIADTAGDLVTSSRSAKVHYERLLDDPNWVIGAGEAYRQVYGGNGIITTPQEAAKAAAIMKAKSDISGGEELRRDETLAFQRQQMMEGIRQANRKEMLDLREKAKSLGQSANDVWIDNYIDKLEEEANTPGKERMSYMTKWGTQPQAPVISVDPVLAKALEKQKVQPGDIMILPDGKYKPIYYKYKDGERIPDEKGGFKVDTELSVPITRDQLKLSLGAKSVSPTQRTKEMLNQQQVSQKKYSYKGKTFTTEQIDKAAKQSNMTVDEYLKKYGIK